MSKEEDTSSPKNPPVSPRALVIIVEEKKFSHSASAARDALIVRLSQNSDIKEASLQWSTPKSVADDTKAQFTMPGGGYAGRVTVLPNNQLLIRIDGAYKIWEIDSQTCLSPGTQFELRRPDGGIFPINNRNLITTPNNLIISGHEGSVKVWDKKAKKYIATLEGHTKKVRCLAMLGDGNRCASGSSEDAVIPIWDISLQRCVATLEGHKSSIYSLILADNGQLISGSLNEIKIWDVDTQQCLKTLEIAGFAYALAMLPGNRLAVAVGDYSGHSSTTKFYLQIWDLSSYKSTAILTGHANTIDQLHTLPDGRLVSVSWDNTVKVWQTSLSHSLTVSLNFRQALQEARVKIKLNKTMLKNTVELTAVQPCQEALDQFAKVILALYPCKSLTAKTSATKITLSSLPVVGLHGEEWEQLLSLCHALIYAKINLESSFAAAREIGVLAAPPSGVSSSPSPKDPRLADEAPLFLLS